MGPAFTALREVIVRFLNISGRARHALKLPIKTYLNRCKRNKTVSCKAMVDREVLYEHI